jgi:periplasmic protein CpxP/Spy
MFRHVFKLHVRKIQGDENQMKIQFLTVAAAALMAAPMLHAQATTPAPTPATRSHAGPRHGGHGAMMKELGLTADQQAKMKAIHQKYAPQMKSAFAASRPDMDAMRAARSRGDTAAVRAARQKMRADMAPTQKVREQEMAEMRGVLTPAQQQKFDSSRAKMKANMGKGGHRDWMGKRGAKPATPANPSAQ